jgi:hypothetical protein
MNDQIPRNPSDDNPDAEPRELPIRGKKDEAPADQLVAYIVVDRSYVRHRTYAAAKQEMKYLKAKTDKMLRILKILQCTHEEMLDYSVAVISKGKPFQVPTE